MYLKIEALHQAVPFQVSRVHVSRATPLTLMLVVCDCGGDHQEQARCDYKDIWPLETSSLDVAQRLARYGAGFGRQSYTSLMSVFMVFYATCPVIESKERRPIAARHVVFVDIKRTSKSIYHFQSLPYKSLVRQRKKKDKKKKFLNS